MQIDNPFLTLELRRHRRRSVWQMLSGGGAILALPLLAEAILRLFPWYRELEIVPSRWVLLGMALVLGLGAGAYVGSRVFLSERRAGLMESLRLLPVTPSRWLVGKLAFPLLFLLVATCLALPPYLIAAVLDLLPAKLALWEWLLPLGVGIVVVAVQLLAGGGSRDDAPLPQTLPVHLLPRKERIERFRQISLSLPLQLLLGQAAFFTFLGRSGLQVSRPFFGVSAPRWLLLAVVIAILLSAAWATAVAGLSATETAERRAGYIRWAAVVGALAILLGVTWGRGLGRLMMLGGLAIPALVFMVWGQIGLRLKRREDRLAEPELAWLERRWDNPLFLRDLRAHTRARSLRGSMVISALVALGVIALVVVMATWGGGMLRRGGWGFFTQFFIQLVIQPVVHLLTRARTLWQQDFQGGRLELLALTPVATADLVRGRAAASILYHLASSWGALMVIPAGLVWLAIAGFWGGVLPILAVVATIVAINCAGGGLGAIQVIAPELTKSYRRRRYRLGTAQFAVVIVALATVGLGVFGHWQPIWAWVAACLALLLLPFILWVSRALFRLRVEELDLLRSGEATWTSATAVAKGKPAS